MLYTQSLFIRNVEILIFLSLLYEPYILLKSIVFIMNIFLGSFLTPIENPISWLVGGWGFDTSRSIWKKSHWLWFQKYKTVTILKIGRYILYHFFIVKITPKICIGNFGHIQFRCSFGYPAFTNIVYLFVAYCPKSASGTVQVLFIVDEMDYLQKVSQDFKNSFWVSMKSRKPGMEN